MTATELTREHYQRPEVKEIILKHCQDGEAWRPLNGDDGWYKAGPSNESVRLLTPEDYDRVTELHRTLYATLDLLEPSVKGIAEKWDEMKRAPEHPIGTLRNCLAFTLSVDIDSIKGTNGEDIVTSPVMKKAVEDAGQFFVNYLRDHGISRSIHCLYSGGGIYVHVHHALFRAKPEWSPDEREQAFRSVTIAFNGLIEDVSAKFFQQHPEHRGWVKFDQLNNQKRKFKCIFSIHKKMPIVVIPLNPDHIEIDFKRASLPLSPEVLGEGKRWYQSYDLTELPRLKELLEPYCKRAEEELKERKARTGDYEISRYQKPVPPESWPPCMRNILEKVEPGRGPHRALANLASYLYQAGWSREDAFRLWAPLASRCGVENRIFDCRYGVLNCPGCRKIREHSAGYPGVGLKGLGYCEPDEKCDAWPGGYGITKLLESSKPHVPTEAEKTAALEILKGLPEKLKTDKTAFRDPGVMKALALARSEDPIEYDICVEGIRSANKGLKITSINKEVDKYIPNAAPVERTPEEEQIGDETPEDIEKEAMKIAETGDPLEFMLNTFNETHKGDRNHAKAQFIAFGLQSALNTKGVFETWGGPSGKGKSDGAKACIRQLPPKYAIISSITAKSLYYRAKEGGIPDGAVLFLDDKKIEEGSDLEETLKRIQTFFQEGAEHETLDGQRVLLRTKLPKRLLVIRTYVNSTEAGTQLNNRSLDLGVDSSKETDKEVCELTLKLAENGQNTDMVTRNTLICRALWEDIKGKVYRVILPTVSQLVEFTDTSNRRNPSLYLDLVIGLACIRHRQRKTEAGTDGETILYAAYKDYTDAAALFNSQGDYLSTRLDKAEIEAVKYVQEQGNEGATLNGIFQHLNEKFPNDGWNVTKVRRLMDGRQDKGIEGLEDKVPGMSQRWKQPGSGGKYKVYSISEGYGIGVQVKVHDPRETVTIATIDLFALFATSLPQCGKEENNNSNTTTKPLYPLYPKKSSDPDNTRPQRRDFETKKISLPNTLPSNLGQMGQRGREKDSPGTEKALCHTGAKKGQRGKTDHDDPVSKTFCRACGDDITEASRWNDRWCMDCGRIIGKIRKFEETTNGETEKSLIEILYENPKRKPSERSLLAVLNSYPWEAMS